MQVRVPRCTGRTNNTKNIGVWNRELFTVGPCKRIGVSCPQEPQSYWSPRLVHQSCPTLCDPMDCTPPGSSVGFSRQGISDPAIEPICLGLQAGSLLSEPSGKQICTKQMLFSVLIKKAQLWLSKVPVLAKQKQSSVDGSQSWLSRGRAQLMAPSGPGPLTLPSCHLWRELGIQPNWPSGSSGHPKRGDQVPQTVTQADCHHHKVAEAGMGKRFTAASRPRPRLVAGLGGGSGAQQDTAPSPLAQGQVSWRVSGRRPGSTSDHHSTVVWISSLTVLSWWLVACGQGPTTAPTNDWAGPLTGVPWQLVASGKIPLRHWPMAEQDLLPGYRLQSNDGQQWLLC